MPTRASAPPRRIHSWSLVYLRSGGYIRLFRSLVERHWNDGGFRAAAADVDFELGAGPAAICRQIRHADRLLQVWRLRAAGPDARLPAVDIHVVAVPADRALLHLEANELSRDTIRLLAAQ